VVDEFPFCDSATLDLALETYSFMQKVNIAEVSKIQRVKLEDAVRCLCKFLGIKLEEDD